VAADPRRAMLSRSHSGLRLVSTVSPTPVTRTLAGGLANGRTFASLRMTVVVRSLICWMRATCSGVPTIWGTFFSSTNGLVRMPRFSLSLRMRSTLWSMRFSVSRPLCTAPFTASIASCRFGGMRSWSTPASSAITGISSGGNTFAPPMPSESVTTTPS
jgi:hypothetical protein